MTIKPSVVHTLLGVVVGFVLFLLTFGVEQYYRYHVSNLYSLDGKEHSYYIYPGVPVDSVLNMVREHYEISGEGDQSVLLLHGWGGSCESWLPVERDLKASKRVINLDFPGFGQSTEPNRPWSVPDTGTSRSR